MIDFKKLPKSISFAFFFIILLTIFSHYYFWEAISIKQMMKADIYYAWKEGVNIVDGINPYARTILGNLRDNDKYPTYLPLVYIFSAVTNKLGFNTFQEFLNIWRPLSLLMHLITGTLVFNMFVKKGFYSLALISSMVLFLGRWSNYIIKVQHIEFLAVASLLVSILIIEKKPLISGLFYAFSLSLKHIAIIFLPIFFIKAGVLIRNRNIFYFGENQKKYLLGIISPIIILVSPFFINSPKGFLYSMLFPLTRVGMTHGAATGVKSILLSADGTKIVGYLLILFFYYVSFKKRIGVFSSCMIILILFLQFNSIIFFQYYYWLITFIFLAIAEALPSKPMEISEGS